MTQTLKLSAAGEKKLVQLEGDKLVAYLDSVGVWTIGKGHTGKDVYKGKRITQAESDRLFQQDQPKYWRPIARFMPNVPVPQRVLEGLFFFSYNLGETQFAQSSAASYFKRMTVFNASTIAALGALMKRYNKGRVKGKLKLLPGLVNRRNQEVAWMQGANKAPMTTKQKVAVGTGTIGGVAVAVDQTGLTDAVDNTGTLQSIVDSSAMFGMTGSTILAALGSIIVVGVLGYIIYQKFAKTNVKAEVTGDE